MTATWHKRIATVSALAATLAAGWLLLLHLRMVISPAPQEMREGAAVWITQLLLDGRNPYALSELPASTNVYGVLYHLVVYPFARVLGNSFAVHRAVSLAAILVAAGIIYRLLRRLAVDPLLSWIGTVIFYMSSVYFVAPLARPDGLGVLLAVASIACLMRERVTDAQFAAGLGLALLALATKIYLAFPPFVMAAYLVVFGPHKRGLAWGVASVLGSVGLLLALSHFFPAYINESLVTNAQGDYRDFGHLVRQTRDWLVFSLPLSVALLITVASTVAARRLERPTPYAFAAAANGCVFFAWLGWHPGAHMTYLFQLVTPVLIPAVWPAVSRHHVSRAAVAAALPIACALNAHYFPLTFERFRESEAAFAAVNQTILAHQQVMGGTEIAGLLALDGRPVVDSGQSEYFNVAGFGEAMPGLIVWNQLEARWEQFVESLEHSISARQYDLIVRSRRNGLIPLETVEEHYRRTGTVDLEFAWSGQQWPVDFWEPMAGHPDISGGSR